MGRVPIDVMQHELDLLWQNVFTWVSWGIVAVMVVIAIRMGRTQRTPSISLRYSRPAWRRTQSRCMTSRSICGSPTPKAAVSQAPASCTSRHSVSAAILDA